MYDVVEDEFALGSEIILVVAIWESGRCYKSLLDWWSPSYKSSSPCVHVNCHVYLMLSSL